MPRCDRCGVSLDRGHAICPLCSGDVSGKFEAGDSTFPAIPIDYHRNSFFKMATGVMGILSVVSLTMGYIFPEAGNWPLIVFAAIVSLWVSIHFVYKNRRVICKNIFFQVVILILLTGMWDSNTGRYFNTFYGWSVVYATPILIASGIVAIAILGFAKRMNVADYALYLLLLSIIGVVCFRHQLSSGMVIHIPIAVCFIVSVGAYIFLLSQIKDILRELRRWLHF